MRWPVTWKDVHRIARRTRRARRCAAALVVLAFATPPRAGAAAEETTVGVVVDLAPATGRFPITRSGQAKPISAAVGVVLQAGDRIAVPERGSIAVLLGDDATHPFTGPGEFVVPAARPIGSAGLVLRGFTASLQEQDASSAADALTRGGECRADDAPERIEVPILRPGAKLVARTTDLPLAWVGGCPPFDLALRRGDVEIASKRGLAARQGRLDAVAFTPGRYAVVVADGRGQRATFALTAVATAPSPPRELAADATRLGVIARALWLADEDGGAWRVDSFELLRPMIREHNRLAGSIGDVLLYRGPDRVAPRR